MAVARLPRLVFIHYFPFFFTLKNKIKQALTSGGSFLFLWYKKDPAAGPVMKEKVIAAVSLESSEERFSAVVCSLTIAVDIVIVWSTEWWKDGGGGSEGVKVLLQFDGSYVSWSYKNNSCCFFLFQRKIRNYFEVC